MNDEERDEYLIDGFIRNALSAVEREELELRMQDPTFEKAVQQHLDLTEVLRHQERLQNKSMIASFESKKSEVPPKIRRIWYYAAVASFIVVVALLIWPRATDGDEIFAQFYAHFPDAITETTRSDLAADVKIDLMQPYNEKKWSEAQVAFERHLDENPEDFEITFYYGLSVLMNDQPGDAVGILATVEKEIGDPDYLAAAQWYGALSLLKSGDLRASQKKLRSIAESNHYKKDEAAEILVKLSPN